MSELKKLDLQQIQKIEYDILDFFDEECKKLGVSYSLVYGTLLGAVRHSGFIPWDDDIDVCMNRENYEKFLKKFSNNNERYKIFNCRDKNKKCNISFTKIIDTYTSADEEGIDNGENYGLWLDVFCIDYLPSGAIKRKAIINYFFLINQIKKTKVLKKPSLMYKILGFFFSRVPISMLAENIDNYGRNALKSKYSINLNCISKLNKKKYFNFDIFSSLTQIKFCDKKFPCFSNYEEVLELFYGKTFMELPPLAEREIHYINARMIKD